MKSLNINQNKFFLQAYLFSKLQKVIKNCWQNQYPDCLEELNQIKIFLKLKDLEKKPIIQAILETGDNSLFSWLKTEVINIEEYIHDNCDEKLKNYKIEIKLKKRL
jgi:hypothetical protein